MKRRKIRRNMSEKKLLKLKRQLRKRAKKLRLGKKRTGAYVYGTLRRVRGNQMRSSFDKPVFGPGNVETRIVRTDTLTGIKEAERLVRDGWYQGRVGLFTTTYYRKRLATPQVAPAWKTGIYTGRGIARNPGMVRPDPWIRLPTITPAQALKEYRPLRKSISDFSEPMLFFKTLPAENPKTIASLARKIGHYNNFNGRKIATFIEKFSRVHPRVAVVLGREYSPVLYLDNVREDLALHIVKNAKKYLKTDEESYDPLRARVRLWWD